ncbi:hypothetical protein RFI_20846 [Reticulomyxa filosa]|uniref:Uncharacterized protein n=1 Tax=Reticulomyxa filosa TaxID=46433 RepID=X6MR73_RETFI|nr:hypothetical protein RFI_20846 [Reticulomyxa filosa]|eukprot:ETO16493.1 hypothetical protein RFI_20846 [Reticulomyxa filosa]
MKILMTSMQNLWIKYIISKQFINIEITICYMHSLKTKRKRKVAHWFCASNNNKENECQYVKNKLILQEDKSKGKGISEKQQIENIEKANMSNQKESKMGKHNNHLNEKFRKNFNYQKKINGEI